MLLIRLPPKAFCRLRVGAFGVLVITQLITSPAAGVTAIGRLLMPLTLVEPGLEQLTPWLYCGNVEVLPEAIASFSV